MFYRVEMEDFIRVPPTDLDRPIEEAIMEQLNEKYSGYVSNDLGIVIGPETFHEVGEGKVLHEDGGVYYKTRFTLITFKPELHEVVVGRITDITDFGAFVDIGPIDGMTHVSQTMDDFVSFSKDKVLQGKNSKKTLKVNDLVRAMIVAVSYKDPTNPKIGLTMRRALLGKPEWWQKEEEKKS